MPARAASPIYSACRLVKLLPAWTQEQPHQALLYHPRLRCNPNELFRRRHPLDCLVDLRHHFHRHHCEKACRPPTLHAPGSSAHTAHYRRSYCAVGSSAHAALLLHTAVPSRSCIARASPRSSHRLPQGFWPTSYHGCTHTQAIPPRHRPPGHSRWHRRSLRSFTPLPARSRCHLARHNPAPASGRGQS